MTVHDRFQRMEPRLPELLTELAPPSVPDYTDDLLARTAASRQRPRWTFIERWLPMDVIARERTVLPGVPWRAIAVAALLLALVASALLIAGAQRRVPPPFGLAANGALLSDADGEIYVRDSLEGPDRLLIGGDGNDIAPNYTRDGTRLTFLRVIDDQPLERNDRLALFLANADGSNVRQFTGPVAAPDWGDISADSRQMIIQMTVDKIPGIHLLDLDTGTIVPVRTAAPSWQPNWRGPDGREIIFRGWLDKQGPPEVAMFAIRPDGTQLRQLTPASRDINRAYWNAQVSPDGRYVTYNGFTDDGVFRIHRLEVDTGTIEPLPLAPGYPQHGFASYSPDGRYLLFHAINGNFTRVRVMVAPADRPDQAIALGPEHQVINDNAELSQTFSPDGSVVIVTQGHDRETRMFDPEVGGLGTVIPWEATGVPAWQRLPLR